MPGTDAPTRITPQAVAYPDELRALEARLIAERRALAGIDPAAERVGLAFSGGGIRSATFTLGVAQVLAAGGLLPRIDLLSSVSGSGYLGACLGAVFVPPELRGGEPDGQGGQERARAAFADDGSRIMTWLRDNGRYLSPNGSGDLALAAAVLVRNWLAILVVLAVAAFALFSGMHALRVALGDGLLGDPSRSGLVMSPWWCLPLAFIALLVVPAGWAYWLVPPTARDLWDRLFSIVFTLVTALGAGALGWCWWRCGRMEAFGGGVVLLLSLVLWLAAWDRGTDASAGIDPPALARDRLSAWLRTGLVLAAAAAALAAIDSLAQTAYLRAMHTSPVAGAGFGLGAAGSALAASFSKQIVVMLSPGDGAKPKLPMRLITLLAGLALAAAGLVVADVLAYAALLGWRSETAMTPTPLVAAAWFGAALALSALFGRGMAFLNQSSQAQLYGARLTRAYLGASNPRRANDLNVTRLVPGDEIALHQYLPHRAGGPLHLINVTFNETVDGRSQVESRDRKGMGLAVGPAAISVGVRHHALWTLDDAGRPRTGDFAAGLSPQQGPGFAVFPDSEDINPEPLTLGQLVAVSGAAFTTGLGAKTALGMSLLCGLFNVRLGLWWRSGVAPARRARLEAGVASTPRHGAPLARGIAWLFPVQAYLIDEFLGRFHGPARTFWYLSDGGHFENTACYELIRRRLPLIVVTDAGQDDDYSFEDIAGLVRKARTDFGAAIAFLAPAELDAVVHPEARPWFGPLEHLRRGAWTREGVPAPAASREPPLQADAERSGVRWDVTDEPRRTSLAHAALAWVRYDGEERPRSLLVLVKPTLIGDEPTDVANYHAANPAFPQESTLDQFFAEAQWESYRMLGEHIARKLFAPPRAADRRWHPNSLDPATAFAARAAQAGGHG